MAELLGVISSSIALAEVVTKLTSSIIKLKDYWNQINDAPDELKWLIRETEMFGLILAEVEAHSAQHALASSFMNNRATMQSLVLCKEASAELDIVVRDLGQNLNSPSRFHRSYAAVKMVAKKNKLEKYKTRLRNVTSLFSVSQQCYTRQVIS